MWLGGTLRRSPQRRILLDIFRDTWKENMMEKEQEQFKKENRKKEPDRRLYSILAVVFAVAFVVCVILMGRNYLKQKKAEEQFDALSELTETAETETSGAEGAAVEDILAQLGIEVPEKNPDWDALREENEDIYAWIYIPGTQVDYPVLQHSTENDYYLNRNLDQSSGYPGCIYTQLYNSKEFTDPNTVLYGHNMGNGTMFGSLHEYEDNTFFEEYPYVYVYTPEKTYVYEIFAACTFSDAHLLYNYDYKTEDGFKEYVDDLTGVRDMKSHVRSDVAVEYGAHLLTLSTCIKNHPNERWLVSAVLLNE